MAQWRKDKIQRENGEWVDAQFPVIVSASRSTDIPAFYADWLLPSRARFLVQPQYKITDLF